MSDEFENFINTCWSNHDKKTEEVAKDLRENLSLIGSSEQIAPYASLIVHTYGGHLGKWDEGRELLNSLIELEVFNNDQAVYRGLASLSYCMGSTDDFIKYLGLSTEEASEVRIYAGAASELTGQGKIAKAKEAFEKAMGAAPSHLTKENPAAKALAISGNNLAAELEEKNERSLEDTELMLLAATSARKYWEIAGGWVEVERAEYRLAMSHLQAGNFEEAIVHARICESICIENKADPFEMFFVHEALTKVNRGMCEHLKTKVKKEYQGYCVVP